VRPRRDTRRTNAIFWKADVASALSVDTPGVPVHTAFNQDAVIT
jgi:hypothetical protein